MLTLDTLLHTITLIAAAGGGGSSSGGSGGGGGEIIALLGYVPSYYLGKLVKKLLPRKAELIVSASSAAVITLLLLGATVLSGNGDAIFFMILVVIGVWTGWYTAFFSTFDKLRGKFTKNKAAMLQAAQTDSTWDQAAIEQQVRDIFVAFQADWSAFNRERIATYTSPRYKGHVDLMLSCLQQLGRTNFVENPVISQLGIIDVVDDKNDSNDRFTAVIEWKASDRAIVIATGKELWKNNQSVVEYWHFVRNQRTWLLDGITQDSAAPWLSDQQLAQFATQNSMYYSLDMGVLYLPDSGILFNQKGQQRKDVNNHVVGTYHGHLVQFYTFSYITGSDRASIEQRLVAQIQLPKSYGGILIESVKSKRGERLFGLMKNKAPTGYTQHQFEWQDFNDRYRVYATDADRLAAFELVNPGFMAYLYDNDPQVSIEVAENIVYLHKPVAMAIPMDYEKFLAIMLTAFKELKM